MLINVKYLPAYEDSPLPNGEKEYNFLDHTSFKNWVIGYVCGNCLADFEEATGHPVETLEDLLSEGCGSELLIKDFNNLIYWNDAIK